MRLAVLLAASLACVGIGFAKSAALSAHVKDLETLQKIIQYLRGEIVMRLAVLLADLKDSIFMRDHGVLRRCRKFRAPGLHKLGNLRFIDRCLNLQIHTGLL